MAVKFTGKFTVWNVYGKDTILDEKTSPTGKKYAEVICSTSAKKKGKYERDFTGKFTFFGDMVDKLKELGVKEKDVIEVKDGSHTNSYDKSKKVTYSNYTVWDFDVVDKEKKVPSTPEVVEPETPFDPLDDKSLPF